MGVVTKIKWDNTQSNQDYFFFKLVRKHPSIKSGRYSTMPMHKTGFSESACKAGDPSSIPELGRSAGEEIGYPLRSSWASFMAQLVKNLLAMWETWVRSQGWENPLEKEKATHSSILVWRIPWTVYIVHGVAESQIWLSNFHFPAHTKKISMVSTNTSSFWTKVVCWLLGVTLPTNLWSLVNWASMWTGWAWLHGTILYTMEISK